MEKIKVAINGYGVIGKRVAYAVQLQEDMDCTYVLNREYVFKKGTNPMESHEM